tara:strand:- start:28 stop:417 length:390 start_codon:yes stop_codon:yes gene_type:complete
MKKSDVKEWVKALRSGDYQQGKSNLCKEDQISGECEYCCLGVACDILTVNEWIKYPNHVVWSIGEHKDFVLTSIANKEGSFWAETTSFPSKEILKKLGLDSDYAQELAELNDKGWSFKKIANKIERDLL